MIENFSHSPASAVAENWSIRVGRAVVLIIHNTWQPRGRRYMSVIYVGGVEVQRMNHANLDEATEAATRAVAETAKDLLALIPKAHGQQS